MDYAMII